jgi:hypothetical protein
LAEVYECGRGVGQDTQQALLHYIRATRGFEMIGDESDAQIARQARASLARSLEPEVAVKIARQANDSKRNGQ